jgi:hypothetical protein
MRSDLGCLYTTLGVNDSGSGYLRSEKGPWRSEWYNRRLSVIVVGLYVTIADYEHIFNIRKILPGSSLLSSVVAGRGKLDLARRSSKLKFELIKYRVVVPMPF